MSITMKTPRFISMAYLPPNFRETIHRCGFGRAGEARAASGIAAMTLFLLLRLNYIRQSHIYILTAYGLMTMDGQRDFCPRLEQRLRGGPDFKRLVAGCKPA